MNQQTHSGSLTETATRLRTLAELGYEGVRTEVETDLTPRFTFPVDPRWYESYWYGNRPASKWNRLTTVSRRFCCEALRVCATHVDAVLRTGLATGRQSRQA